jgi:nucleotide-binding universal stress UspA family protein
MKILIAVDGSEFTRKMLTYLTTHDSMFATDHQYTLITVQPPLPPRARSAVGADIVKSYYADEVEKVLAPAAKFLTKKGIDAAQSWKVGPPGEVISKFAADNDFDLLIMGSHGHGALGNLVMGSVVTQVVAHCKVPLLIVR